MGFKIEFPFPMSYVPSPQLASVTDIDLLWLRTLEEGIHTYDNFEEGKSKQKVGTKEFAEAVVKRMGQKPEKLKPVAYSTTPHGVLKPPSNPPVPSRELVGVDIYVEWLVSSGTSI